MPCRAQQTMKDMRKNRGLSPYFYGKVFFPGAKNVNFIFFAPCTHGRLRPAYMGETDGIR
jgi:hypothetical protein